MTKAMFLSTTQVTRDIITFLRFQVSPVNPIKLFAEVTLNSVPVMDARVTAELRALNQSGYLTPPIRVELLDTGSGGEII